MQATLKIALRALPLLLVAQAAHADVCVSIAEDRDTLDDVDRKGVIMLAESSFETLGEKVVPAPCPNEYKLANIRLGESVTAVISGPKGSERGQALTVADLGNVYDQLIRALITGKPVSESVTRENVTEKQANPNRVKADSLWVFRIGTGYVTGTDLGEVPITIGGGYRYELDDFAVEAGFDSTISVGSESGENDGAHFGGFVGGLYFLDGQANMSPYVGAALGLGGTVVSDLDYTYSGGGLEGRLTAGYAFFRASTIRMIIEFDATLPFYDLERDGPFKEIEGAPVGDSSKYAPVFGLTLGVGYDP